MDNADMLKVSIENFNAGKYRLYGTLNPQVMNCPFWEAMIKTGMTAWEARQQFAGSGESIDDAVWCYERFGISKTKLPDGRLITIGGEHEDFYDYDFCIYNDVIVFDSRDKFKIYGYPKDVFPPTDFHSATLVGHYIYIIGSLGYMGERRFNETPVYQLDTNSFEIQAMVTQGDMPGWIDNHEALYLEQENAIYISGGLLSTLHDGKEVHTANIDDYVLKLSTNSWSKVTT